jgi:hypothetical protein
MAFVKREVRVKRERLCLPLSFPRILEGKDFTFTASLTVEDAHEIWLNGSTGIQIHFNGLDACH